MDSRIQSALLPIILPDIVCSLLKFPQTTSLGDFHAGPLGWALCSIDCVKQILKRATTQPLWGVIGVEHTKQIAEANWKPREMSTH
jgi:hypothetical protein